MNPEKNKILNIELSNAQVERVNALQPLVEHILQPRPPCCPPITKDAASSADGACCSSPVPANSDVDALASTAPGAPCCGPRVMPRLTYRKVTADIRDGIPHVTSILSGADHYGAFRARLGKFRMNYAIAPGLYALGSPDADSSVLVTANYKLSFDHLRSHLNGCHLWILVLDTWGINVWCAAGKGTFGTAEVVRQIRKSNLAQQVITRRIILPQLGAPGVAGHEVKKQTGFSVVWGPVEARHLKEFLARDGVATPGMRTKEFPFFERLALLPIELRPALEVVFFALLVLAPLAAIGWPAAYLSGVVHYFVLFSLFAVTGVVAGAVATPLLLPFLPGRAFSAKSILPSVAGLGLLSFALRDQVEFIELLSLGLIAAALAAYAAMNFTGATTYTSVSGVKKEMKYAIPVQIAAASSGICLWIASIIIR
jgi:hypothetical protein